MNRRGFHQYLGGRNSRGKRKLSKIHKGVASGDVERAFQEVEKLKEKRDVA